MLIYILISQVRATFPSREGLGVGSFKLYNSLIHYPTFLFFNKQITI